MNTSPRTHFVADHAAPERGDGGSAVRPASRRRRRSQRSGRAAFTIPASLVFWSAFIVSLATAAVVVLEPDAVAAAFAGAILSFAGIWIDDRYGFSTSREMPRHGEARRRLTGVEVLCLAATLVANVFVALMALVGALSA